MSKNPRLSLCMIVKDEEDCIERCLDSIKDIVDEIVIVDTGSNDKTLEICKYYGARTYSFQWNGNFADARNFGLELATGDWIIFLDADEELDCEEHFKLQEYLLSEEVDVYSLHILNYYGEYENMKKIIQMSSERLFRNYIGLKFINPIHEILNIENLIENSRVAELQNIKIHHYGYLNHVIEKKQKSKRNTDILHKEIQQDDSFWKHYYLAAEYHRVGRFLDALEQIDICIKQAYHEGISLASFVFEKKISCLISMGRMHEALEEIEGTLVLYPDYVDIWFHKGTILFSIERYEDAIHVFEQCLSLGEVNTNYHTIKGVGSYLSWYNKGLCLQQLEQWDESLNCYIRALDMNPLIPAWHQLMKVLEQSVQINSEEKFLPMLKSLTELQSYVMALHVIDSLENHGITGYGLKYIKGVCFQGIGLITKAKPLFINIPPSSSHYISALTSLCMIAWAEEDVQEAESCLEKIKTNVEHDTMKIFPTYSQLNKHFTDTPTDSGIDLDDKVVYRLFLTMLEMNKPKQINKLFPLTNKIKSKELRKQVFQFAKKYGYIEKKDTDSLSLTDNIPNVILEREFYKNILMHHPQPDYVRLQLAKAILGELKEILSPHVAKYPNLQQLLQAIPTLEYSEEAP